MYRGENMIPCAMATQHPDNAKRYIPVQKEPEEAIECLKDLDCDEYFVDYEGKLTPYHQTVQITLNLLHETDLIPGKDVRITPRIPSSSEETLFRQLMALMSTIEADYKAKEVNEEAGILEVVHPMTKSADELVGTKRWILSLLNLCNNRMGKKADDIHLIPLIEEVPELLNASKILKEYYEKCQSYNIDIPYMRVFFGRSDPALSYGFLPAVLSVKCAISEVYDWSDEVGLDVYPIIGAGSLPFRGHVTYENISNFVNEYKGIRTVSIQSALRYDHGPEKTRKTAKYLKEKLPKNGRLKYDDYQELIDFVGISTKHYLRIFYRICDKVNTVSDWLPNMRDRLSRKAPVGYARDVPKPEEIGNLCSDEIKVELEPLKVDKLPPLPRAIKFTGALYTMGIPPEFIGTGKALEETKGEILYYYPSLKSDLEFASHYVCIPALSSYFDKKIADELKHDLKLVEEYLDVDYGYATHTEELHWALADILASQNKDISEEEKNYYVQKMAEIRKSLG
ncbi:MAG: phosphoenolpyruvate carboxylase [Methanothermococcus sp.]|jgi:phosphoenolpyruvate carboxylase|nr:phosphoenolpyruvate carboxylase [Methanothermococcus sp.]MDK2987494.1 phosphoenolpyruvate carboxylase [Methanothermococcus sp.]